MAGSDIQPEGKAITDANIAVNVERGFPAWEKDRALKGRVAIVGFGPSLAETWPRIRDFETIWTVSKAHDFLIERGIVPTYHTDVDPREEKATFMQAPHPDVTYVMSTGVHPSFLDKLEAAGSDVRLFHVAVDPKQMYDRRYPVSTVRFDAGLQAAELAFQHGHREQHWFGIEYGTRGDEHTHAGPHEGAQRDHQDKCKVDVDGALYDSTSLFVHGLFMAEDMLCKRALLRCTLHGNGLLGPFLLCRGRTRPHIEP